MKKQGPKQGPETSKILLWSVIGLASVISIASLVLAYMSHDFDVTVTVIGGLWGASVPVAIGCYSDKAKAENEIKLQQIMQGPPPELTQAQSDLSDAMADNKKLKADLASAKKENGQLKQRLTPLEEIIKQAQTGTSGAA